MLIGGPRLIWMDRGGTQSCLGHGRRGRGSLLLMMGWMGDVSCIHCFVSGALCRDFSPTVFSMNLGRRWTFASFATTFFQEH